MLDIGCPSIEVGAEIPKRARTVGAMSTIAVKPARDASSRTEDTRARRRPAASATTPRLWEYAG